MARLLIVDPSIGQAETGATANLSALWGGPTIIVCPALTGWAGLDMQRDKPAGMIVMGSAASARDASDWRDEIVQLLELILAGTHALPLLGICWGHQLIAQTAGATIDRVRADGQKLLGMRSISTIGLSPLFEDSSYQAAVSHSEMVCAPPPDFRLIASNDECLVHGLQHMTLPIFSLQCHPELPFDSLVRLGYDGEEDPQRVADGSAILRRFMAICRATATADAGSGK